MIQTHEAVIDGSGQLRFLDPVKLPFHRRAVVLIFEVERSEPIGETALLSEAALSDWNRPEEDEAWSFLQSAK